MGTSHLLGPVQEVLYFTNLSPCSVLATGSTGDSVRVCRPRYLWGRPFPFWSHSTPSTVSERCPPHCSRIRRVIVSVCPSYKVPPPSVSFVGLGRTTHPFVSTVSGTWTTLPSVESWYYGVPWNRIEVPSEYFIRSVFVFIIHLCFSCLYNSLNTFQCGFPSPSRGWRSGV